MFILGDYKKSPDEMNREDISDGFHSHTEEAGRRVMEYLWKIGVLKTVKDEGQLTINDLMNKE